MGGKQRPGRGIRTRWTVTGTTPDTAPPTAVQAAADYLALRLTVSSLLEPSRKDPR